MRTQDLAIGSIRISPLNTRRDLEAGTEDSSLDDLAESIRERGLIQPVVVTPSRDGYELIAGQRRYLACKQLGMTTIAAVVRSDLDATDATVLSLIENVHRAEMSPMDKARAYQQLHRIYGTKTRVAQQTGVSVATVTRYMRLLGLSPSLQQRASTSDGPAGVGTLSTVATTFDNPQDQERAVQQIGGFNQKTQKEILKRSGGDVEKVGNLVRQAMEGHFDIIECSERLCVEMPPNLKDRVKRILSNPGNAGTAALS